MPLDQLEREYSPSSLAPNFLHTIKRYQTLSASALARASVVKSIAYGQHLDEFVLVHLGRKPACSAGFQFPITQPAGKSLQLDTERVTEQSTMLVFIHGGYWQELSALDSLFGAQAIGRIGINWAAINYGLAPTVSLEVIVQRCKHALTMLAEHDPKGRFVLVGSSAGAHLVASLMADPAVMAALSGRIAGALLLSGVYDLEPLVGTYINNALGLTKQAAAQLSPIRQKFACEFPVVLAFGERETLEFKRQSADFAERLRSCLLSVQMFEVANRDHFDIVFDISDPGTAIGRIVKSWSENQQRRDGFSS